MEFIVHSTQTASEESARQLEDIGGYFGFVPNLLGVMAESPQLLKAYLQLGQLFSQTSLSPVEQQVVLLQTSYTNDCTYCVAAHTTIAAGQNLPEDVVDAIREDREIGDPRLEALRRFTVAVVKSRGWPDQQSVDDLMAAGYSNQNVLEIVLGVGMKTLSNYTNHMAATPLDPAFEKAVWAR